MKCATPLARLAITAALVFNGGCAYVELRTKDVTADPSFCHGYGLGETYRLKADGRLILRTAMPTYYEHLELMPTKAGELGNAAEANEFVAAIPAGSTVVADGLVLNYTFAIPPVPGETQVLRAYGTLRAGGQTWTRVLLPDDESVEWSRVPKTEVLRFPPNLHFMEKIRATLEVSPEP